MTDTRLGATVFVVVVVEKWPTIPVFPLTDRPCNFCRHLKEKQQMYSPTDPFIARKFFTKLNLIQMSE